MGTSLRKLSVVVALVLGMAGTSACQPPPPVTKVTNTVNIRCTIFTYATPVDWYFPGTTPKALVWLQHGFAESKSDWDELGRKAAAQGFLAMATTLPIADLFGCTVQNLGNNTAYLDNVAALFAGIADPNSALGQSHAAAASQAGRAGQALPQKLALAGHSAGGEAVLYVANRLRTAHATTFAKLKGLVLEDPVKSIAGTSTEASLVALNGTTLPIYALASPPYSCNANQSGTVLVSQKLTTRPFHGVQVTTGSHGDVFGSSLNGLEELTCGTPQSQNVTAVQALTLGWLGDQVAGTSTASLYPGGTIYNALVTAGTITTLP